MEHDDDFTSDEFETSSNSEDPGSESAENDEQRVEPRPIYTYRKFYCSYPNCNFSCRNHHRFSQHLELEHECEYCGNLYADRSRHNCPLEGQHHQQHGAGSIDTSIFKLAKSAHGGVLQTFEFTPDKLYTSLNDIFIELEQPITRLLSEALDILLNIKVMFRILIDLEDVNKKLTKEDVWLSSSFLTIRHTNFIESKVEFALAYLNNTLAIFSQNKSGYTLKKIKKLEIIIAKYIPLVGGYDDGSTLPKELKNRRGLRNISGSTHYCFHFAIIAAFHETEALDLYRNKKRLEARQDVKLSREQIRKVLSDSSTYLPFIKRFNFDGITAPVSIEEIAIFEQKNDVSVNVYGIKGNQTIVLKSSEDERNRHVDLVLVQGVKGSHYVLVKDLSAFLGQHGKSRHVHCRYCLRRFLQPHALRNHMTICGAKNVQTVTYPKEDFYEFKNMYETLRFPYVLYYDFETFNQAIFEKEGENSIFTGKVEPAQYSLVLAGPDGLVTAKTYDDESPKVVQDLLRTALAMADDIGNYLKINNKVYMTAQNTIDFQSATRCFLCNSEFTKKNYKTNHHCHWSSQHLGAACAKCNGRAKTQYMVPIVSHGGTNFDHHLIIKGLKRTDLETIKIIPQSTQNFLGFTYNKKLKFCDSNRFLPGKLSSHAKSLLKDGEQQFEILFQYFKRIKSGEDFYKVGGYSDDDIRLLLGKLPFPYDIMTDRSCFSLTELPPIEKFYNSLKMKHIKEDSYLKAKEIWQTFNIRNFKEFSRLYNITDTLILACIMEAQRKATFKEYGIEMMHKWSGPGVSHSAGMLSSKAKIQYMKSEDMISMIKSGIRGGVCVCNTRLVTANNERVGNFDPTKERTHILYCDLKSLYPFCLLNAVPTDSYTWMTDDELDNLDVSKLDPAEGIGYIFECDLQYDRCLHDSHNDFPMGVTKRVVDAFSISATQAEIAQNQGVRNLKELKAEKLVLTLEDKTNYVVYYKNLIFYLKHGLKLKGRIKRGIKFNEKPVFREYIGNNLAKREKETSEVTRMVIKTASNSFYGKTLQSYSKYKDIIICTTRAQALKLIKKPEFHDMFFVSPEITIFAMNRLKYKEDSLFFIGFVVLELSKLRLLEVHYEGMKNVFQDRIQLAYTDTDSGVYIVRDPSNSYLSDLKALSSIFDYSGFPKNHPLYDSTNVGRAGVFKLEALDIREFCGLSAKLYSYKKLNSNEEKKAKGISKAVIKRSIHHEDYVRTVNSMMPLPPVSINLIRNKNHQLYYQTIKKVALSALDLKRVLLPDGINTYAIGHYRAKEMISKEFFELYELIFRN